MSVSDYIWLKSGHIANSYARGKLFPEVKYDVVVFLLAVIGGWSGNT
jgi:hypothetical protein